MTLILKMHTFYCKAFLSNTNKTFTLLQSLYLLALKFMRLPLSKCFIILAVMPLIFAGCSSPTKTQSPITLPIPTFQKNQIYIPKQEPTEIQDPKWIATPPADYVWWINNSNNQARVKEYEKYLQEHRVTRIAPTHQILRSARSWQQCGRDPYSVPSPELWGNALPTLKILQYLVDTQVLRDFEITSVYRDYSLNICAGGAAGSKHVYNSAIDFRLGPVSGQTTTDYLRIEDTKRKLCDFWRQYGQTLNMGLGVYSSGQIHIDTQGYRSWGPDLTRNSSICQP